MMNARRKVKRIKPLVRIRKNQLDQEVLVLIEIRQRKQLVLKELIHFQTQYMKGVEQLNIERQSPTRHMLSSLEQSVDYARARWFESYQKVQEAEREERAQLFQLRMAEKDLKSVQKLEERYEQNARTLAGAIEQKQLDESAIRNFTKERKSS
jgi:flagellar biosynthesis chaperone FliJ